MPGSPASHPSLTAVDLVNLTSGRPQTILRLQLAAALVQRGLDSKTGSILSVSFSILACSLRLIPPT